MKDEAVYPFHEKWYCKACFDRLETGISAASRDILSRKCHRCYKEFAPGALVSECRLSFLLIERSFELSLTLVDPR